MVLMTEEEEELRSIIERSREYLEDKKLELHTDKTNIIRFRKKRGKETERYGGI